MRLLVGFLLLSALMAAGILPETIGAFHRVEVSEPPLNDSAIWTEYGLKSSETARYQNGGSHFTARAWQFQDTTGAMAAFDWQRPANSHPAAAASQSAETADALFLVHGNYL